MPPARRTESEVLSYILSFHMKHGEYPSQRTVAAGLPMSLGTVNRNYQVLVKKGQLRLGLSRRIIWAGFVPTKTGEGKKNDNA